MSKITIDRAVVEQAIVALTAHPDWRRTMRLKMDTIDSLRAALEQPQVEQEPVAWKYHYTDSDGDLNIWSSLRDPKKIHAHELARLSAVTPLYTHPQPPRQPLTDEQVNDHRLALAYDSEDLPDPWDFKQGVRAAERAHGIGGKA